jgi:hypothetical protein
MPEVKAACQCLLGSFVPKELCLRKSAFDIHLDNLCSLQISFAVNFIELVVGEVGGHQLFVFTTLSLEDCSGLAVPTRSVFQQILPDLATNT